MLKNIRHTGIVVDDLEKSLAFYCDLLGFKVQKRADESGPFINAILALERGDVTTVKMTAPDGQMVELLAFKYQEKVRKSKALTDVGLTHIAFTVDDLDAVYKTLSEAGTKFLSSPQRSPDGAASVAFCVSPEGIYLELVEMIET